VLKEGLIVPVVVLIDKPEGVALYVPPVIPVTVGMDDDTEVQRADGV
jgi:hypothetical protein